MITERASEGGISLLRSQWEDRRATIRYNPLFFNELYDFRAVDKHKSLRYSRSGLFFGCLTCRVGFSTSAKQSKMNTPPAV